MCGGGRPQAPRVEYVGPSQADIDRNQRSLDQYQQQMMEQQSQFQSQLQSQIDAANAQTAELEADFAAESAAAAAASSADQAAAYTTSAQQTKVPEGAQTTTAVTAKKKPKKNLKISTGGTMASAGSGLNIGV